MSPVLMQAKLTLDFAETKLYKIRCKFDSACHKKIEFVPQARVERATVQLLAID
jgi:hypothetical protein